MAGQSQHLPWRNVKEDSAGWRHLIHRGHRHSSNEFAPERPQIRYQGSGKLLRAALRQRPANGVPEHAEHESEGRGWQFIKGHDGVRCQAGEEATGARTSEPRFR
jgi:hypothetical protein